MRVVVHPSGGRAGDADELVRFLRDAGKRSVVTIVQANAPSFQLRMPRHGVHPGMAAATAGQMVWHDGRLRPAAEVRLSPFDQGLTIGLGAFETLVACDGEPFAFRRHWDRLTRSCRGLELPLPDRDAVADALRAVARANHHLDGRLRVTVTAGPGPLGSGRGESSPPTVLVVSGPRTVWPEKARVITVPWPRNEHSPLAGLKSTSYAENALALAEARRHGADEALFPNTEGHLCEGTGSNVFWVEDGLLLTPPLTDGCLGGITRALVLELARHIGVAVQEKSLPIAALRSASEVFLTSTTRDIQPVAQIDAFPLPDAGPLTRALQLAWRDRFPKPEIDP